MSKNKHGIPASAKETKKRGTSHQEAMEQLEKGLVFLMPSQVEEALGLLSRKKVAILNVNNTSKGGVSHTYSWYTPDVMPITPGFYQATLDPSDTAMGVVRYWDGELWSMPFYECMDIGTKRNHFRMASLSRPYWRVPAEDDPEITADRK